MLFRSDIGWGQRGPSLDTRFGCVKGYKSSSAMANGDSEPLFSMEWSISVDLMPEMTQSVEEDVIFTRLAQRMRSHLRPPISQAIEFHGPPAAYPPNISAIIHAFDPHATEFCGSSSLGEARYMQEGRAGHGSSTHRLSFSRCCISYHDMYELLDCFKQQEWSGDLHFN